MSEQNKQDLLKIIDWHKIEPSEIVYKNGEDKQIIRVFHQISLANRIQMIKEIFDMVFDNEQDNPKGKPMNIDAYHPELLTFAKRCAVITYFTDIELPNDLGELSELVMNTEIYSDVMKKVHRVVNEIFEEADDMIDAHKQSLLANRNFNSVMSKINTAIDTLTAQFKDVNVDELKGIISQLKGVDANNIIQTILNSGKKE